MPFLTKSPVDLARAQASLTAAQLCLEQHLLDSAVNRAYFAMFQAAISALEVQGIRRREWTHKGVHTDFVSTFVRRRKIIPISFAGALPRVMELRHTADYEQPGVSQRQAEKAVHEAEEFLAILRKEVFHEPEA
jgi:uncharacterized protein (UPF0332 family)